MNLANPGGIVARPGCNMGCAFLLNLPFDIAAMEQGA